MVKIDFKSQCICNVRKDKWAPGQVIAGFFLNVVLALVLALVIVLGGASLGLLFLAGAYLAVTVGQLIWHYARRRSDRHTPQCSRRYALLETLRIGIVG